MADEFAVRWLRQYRIDSDVALIAASRAMEEFVYQMLLVNASGVLSTDAKYANHILDERSFRQEWRTKLTKQEKGHLVMMALSVYECASD